MLRLTLFVLFAVGIDPNVGQECSLQLVPQVPIMQVDRGNNVSILCDASCFGRISTNRLSWYDRHNQPIGMSGRVFSVRYNRGMFARLILLNVDFSETGRYTCAGRVGADVVQKHIDITVTDTDFEVVEYIDAEDGPRRGDVRIDEPFLPKRRPVRSAENMTSDTETTPTPTRYPSDNQTDGSGTAAEIPQADDIGNTITTSQTTDPSPVGTTETNEPDSRAPTTTDQTSSTIKPTPDRRIPATTDQTSSTIKPKPDSRIPATTDQTSSSIKPTQPRTSEQITTDQTTTTAATTSKTTTGNVPTEKEYPGTHKRDKTAFGKYGVLAFALALSVAILLLYTLILLNVIIPRCCTNKQSVSFREAPDNKHKENGPSAIDAIAMKPLETSCPNSPDDGFTTVDLDDKNGPTPMSNTPEKKETDEPVSPTSDPGSPSKFVSTFLIGRKPSESSPLGVYLHEGKPVDTVQTASETGNEGTSDPKPEVKTGETTVAGGTELGGEAAKEGRDDVDTSTEVDTSTDTRDTSASSSDIGDLSVSGAKT